uniref:Uncharacterized protein n=1 Tax=Arthonia quintaria TaxID=2563724 RepID=A0A4P8VTZ0_9PEZI|nr:hypothetical protein [Arthonia quintaria]
MVGFFYFSISVFVSESVFFSVTVSSFNFLWSKNLDWRDSSLAFISSVSMSFAKKKTSASTWYIGVFFALCNWLFKLLRCWSSKKLFSANNCSTTEGLTCSSTLAISSSLRLLSITINLSFKPSESSELKGVKGVKGVIGVSVTWPVEEMVCEVEGLEVSISFSCRGKLDRSLFFSLFSVRFAFISIILSLKPWNKVFSFDSFSVTETPKPDYIYDRSSEWSLNLEDK